MPRSPSQYLTKDYNQLMTSESKFSEREEIEPNFVQGAHPLQELLDVISLEH
jgi:hypothetical protein